MFSQFSQKKDSSHLPCDPSDDSQIIQAVVNYCANGVTSADKIESILKAGATILVTNNEGKTPVHLAAEENALIVLYLFHKNNPDEFHKTLSILDFEGHSPLYIAANEGNDFCVKYLLACGSCAEDLVIFPDYLGLKVSCSDSIAQKTYEEYCSVVLGEEYDY